MRIRKNAKLSPLLFSSSSSQGGGGGGSIPLEAFQTHVCQLNQSPWDVIPFDFDSIKFEVDDRFNHGCAGVSFGTVENESVASMMDTIDDVAMMVLVDDNHDNLHGSEKVAVDNKGLGKKKNSCYNAMDSKGLLCKNGVKQGHHLSLLRSHSHINNATTVKATVKKTQQPAVVAGSRRGRPRGVVKKGSGSGSSSSSNPNEFYYYSGFGPLWGKRRGDKNEEGTKNIGIEGNSSTMLESSNVDVNVSVLGGVDNDNAVVSNIGVFDFVDDDDEEEDCDNDDVNGKKRMRKPVKERSLKSLM